MDYLDWITDGAGGALGLLSLGLGLSRLSGSVERDITPLWQLAFIAAGAGLAAALILGWIFPVEVTIYLANAGDAPRQVRMGDETRCLPGKSYDDFSWRLSPPDVVLVGGRGRETRYEISKGTWLINTAPATVSADMYDTAGMVDFDALNAHAAGAIRINSHFGRPLRMFSQSSFDRVYSVDGDVLQRSTSGPCPDSTAARRSAQQQQ